MFLGLLVFAIIASAVFASEIFWELLTGLALFGLLAGVVQLDPGTALTGLLLLVGCCWHWARYA